MVSFLQHVDNVGLMPLSDRPFHLLGIGNGASIAAAFACRHASRARWQPTVRALVCVNGFAAVDAQLAAVLHSAQGAFRCFPPERPDLPTTFWSRYTSGRRALYSNLYSLLSIRYVGLSFDVTPLDTLRLRAPEIRLLKQEATFAIRIWTSVCCALSSPGRCSSGTASSQASPSFIGVESDPQRSVRQVSVGSHPANQTRAISVHPSHTCRFIFSDAYLKTVGSDLALNIFCAVANPLGAEGMLRIVKGALGSRDLRKDLPSITLPLILIQVRTGEGGNAPK